MGVPLKAFVFLTIAIVTTVSEILSEEKYAIECSKKTLPSSKYINKCCEFESRKFAAMWYQGNYFLTSYLATLQNWKCKDFTQECSDPTYNFTKFTSHVYTLFCDKDQFKAKCSNEINQKIGNLSENALWNYLADTFNSSDLISDLVSSCTAALLFEHYGTGDYVEVMEPHFPFCDTVWGGIDRKSQKQLQLSPWKMVSTRCRISVGIGMLLMGIMAVCITVANTAIIMVFAKYPKMRNSQFFYKFSIAVADLIVGAIVFPTLLVNQYNSLISPRTRGFSKTVNREHDNIFESNFERNFINFSGFFTTLSLFASIYTLTAASFDRLHAVLKPIQYHRRNPLTQAKILCGVLWVAAIIMSSLPLYISDVRYGIIVGGLVVPSGVSSVWLLLVTFVCPLLIVWIMTFLTFMTSMKHAKLRKSLGIHHFKRKQNSSLEFRLARTLSLMVGVFSACIIPSIILLLVQALVPNLAFNKPRSLDIGAVRIMSDFQYCIVFVLMSNSLWNFFIYSARDKSFRSAFGEQIGRSLHKCHFARNCDKAVVAKVERSKAPKLSNELQTSDVKDHLFLHNESLTIETRTPLTNLQMCFKEHQATHITNDSSQS